jgi:hypothetical protein
MSRPAAAWLIPLLLAGWLPASPAPAAEPVDVTTMEGPPKHDAIVELAKPFHESPVRRFETVFFISLPFTALYGSLITTAAGYAIQGKRFRLTTPVLAVDLSAACALAAWIAGRDARAWRDTPAVSLPFPPPVSATPALPSAPELSATTAVPSSTVLR